MFINGKADEIGRLIPTIWSPLVYAELRAKIAYLNLFSRDYEGAIANVGDTVKVQTIVAPNGEILTDDKSQFNPEELQVDTQSLVADRRAVASFEITDMAKLQSLEFQMEAIAALSYAIQKQMEQDVMSIMIPSASAPDHIISALVGSTFDVADAIGLRTLLAASLVPIDENTYLACGTTHYGSLMQKAQVVSSDYGSVNSLIDGDVRKLGGMKVFEHNLETHNKSVAFHRNALQLVMQTAVNIQVSNLHVNKKFGFLVSADIVYGRKLFDNKRLAYVNA